VGSTVARISRNSFRQIMQVFQLGDLILCFLVEWHYAFDVVRAWTICHNERTV
jgi:hypothetical protein